MKSKPTRLDRYISRMALSAVIVSFSILPVQAFQGQYSAFNDNHGLRSSINAGFRLSIPFGPTSRAEDKIKYGFQLNLRREFNNNAGWNNHRYLNTTQTLNADIISLNFSENGFKGLSLADQETFIYKDGVLRLDEGKDKEGGGKGWLFGMAIGVGILVVVGVSNAITE